MTILGGAMALIMDDIFMAWLLFSAINAGIVKVALLGGAAAVAIYLGYRGAKRSTS
jgi:hypothetical protein